MAVAEIASDDPIGTTVAYTDGPDRYHTAYSFVFLRQSAGARHIRRSVERMRAASSTAWPSWAFSNHDVERVVSRWGADPAHRAAFAKVLIAALTSLRGTAFLYQGEELGLPQADVPFERLQDPEGKTFWPEHKGRDGSRTPFPWTDETPNGGFSSGEPWLPIDPVHLSLAASRQERDEHSVLAFTRRFLRWRKAWPPLIDGDIRFFETDEPILAFERKTEAHRLLCAFNLGSKACEAAIREFSKAEVLNGHGLEGRVAAGRVLLPPFGALFAVPSH